MRSRRRIVLTVMGLLLVAGLAMKPPSADIRILAHSADDSAPSRMQAGVNIGLLAVSLLVTWSSKRLRD
ncbi:hypothetical protein [Sphingosinithalassobacter sp. LHW66-3]|uniref:hypothetical protein n=1 Tax=Sphingosinithalassobacter sp. LHW66-3 TaxID=3424718 RepID=UPI003D6BBDF3